MLKSKASQSSSSMTMGMGKNHFDKEQLLHILSALPLPDTKQKTRSDRNLLRFKSKSQLPPSMPSAGFSKSKNESPKKARLRHTLWNPEKEQSSKPKRTQSCPREFFAKMSENETCNQVTVVIGPRAFSVERDVLSKHSRYFKQRFSTGQVALDITQLMITQEDFKNLLGWMHSGKLNLTLDNAAAIIDAAQRLEMPNVVNECTNFLVSALKSSLGSGEGSSASVRMRRAFREVVRTVEFLEYSLEQVLELVSDDSIDIRKEKEVFDCVVKWLNHDWKTRRAYAQQLMSHVRFGLMADRDLLDITRKNVNLAVMEVPACQAYALYGLLYHSAQRAGTDKEQLRFAPKPRFWLKNKNLESDKKKLKGDRGDAVSISSSVTDSEITDEEGYELSDHTLRHSLLLVACSSDRGSPINSSPVKLAEDEQCSWIQTQQLDNESSQSVIKSSECPSSINFADGDLLKDHQSHQGNCFDDKSLKSCWSTDSSQRELQDIILKPEAVLSSENIRLQPSASLHYTNSILSQQTSTCKTEVAADSNFYLVPKCSAVVINQSNTSIPNRSVELQIQRLQESEHVLHSHQQEILKRKREHAAILIQAFLRGYHFRLRFLRKKAAAIVIQKFFRRYRIRKLTVKKQSLPSALPLPVINICLQKETTILTLGGVNPFNWSTPDNTGKEIFQFLPTENKWRLVGVLPEPRVHAAATRLEGCIYVTGGCHPQNSDHSPLVATATVWELQLRTSKWQFLPPMLQPRTYHGLSAMDRKLYAIGGLNHKRRLLKSVEIFDLWTLQWSSIASISIPRMSLAVATYQGHVWACGGFCIDNSARDSGQATASSIVECYSYEGNRWKKMAPLRVPRCFASLAVFRNRLCLIGGAVSISEGTLTSTVDIDIYKHNSWSKVMEMDCPRHDAGVAVIDDYLHVFGGASTKTNHALNSMECYCYRARSWLDDVSSLPHPLVGMTSVTAPSSLTMNANSDNSS